MKWNPPSFILTTLMVIAAVTIENAAGLTSSALTAREQSQLLKSSGIADQSARGSHRRFLSDIEDTIRRANPGRNSQSLRYPVSERALRNLQVRSALRGTFISRSELRAATDYAHALLVEGNGRVSLVEKVQKLPDQLRKPFHGKVAEMAEARERGMVLNKRATATTWDLTEPKPRPCNYQMKIYARHDSALSEILDDLDNDKLQFNKRGILTRDTLEHGVKNGRLVKEGRIFRPIDRLDIRLEPSQVFSRPAESHLYAKTGRESLIQRGLTAEGAELTGLETAGKWLGRAGIAVMAGTEIYLVYGLANGRLSEREFVTVQSEILGGGLGGWGGMAAGAALGALVPPPFDLVTVPVGAVIGGIAGGFGGAKLGEMAASGFYGRLDEKQRRQVAAFIYERYGVST